MSGLFTYLCGGGEKKNHFLNQSVEIEEGMILIPRRMWWSSGGVSLKRERELDMDFGRGSLPEKWCEGRKMVETAVG